MISIMFYLKNSVEICIQMLKHFLIFEEDNQIKKFSFLTLFFILFIF